MKIIHKIFLFLIIIIFLANTSYASLKNERVDKISKNLRCLICQGQSIYDSQSDFALSVRDLISKKIDEGEKDDNIYKYLKR